MQQLLVTLAVMIVLFVVLKCKTCVKAVTFADIVFMIYLIFFRQRLG